MSDTDPEATKKPMHRSPNYPSHSLEWAISTAIQLMDTEGLHAVPDDIFAQRLGYKDATNGKAKRVLAGLKAFGVVGKAAAGKLAVSKEVQRYKLIPSAAEKSIYLNQWLRRPMLYRKLLEKYSDGLPSDAVLKFELVDEHGFSEDAATAAIKVFKESVDFVDRQSGGFNSNNEESDDQDATDDADIDAADGEPNEMGDARKDNPIARSNAPLMQQHADTQVPHEPNSIPYPVRLAGGRMAYVVVPTPFYERDKQKLAAQIGIIGTVDEDEAEGLV